MTTKPTAKTKPKPTTPLQAHPLDYAPTTDATPERASRTAYIAGLIAVFTFGLLLGALMVSA